MSTPAETHGITPGLDPVMASECLQGFLAAIPHLIYFKDRQSRFILTSQSKARRHGLSHDDLLGKSDADLFADGHAQWTLADEESVMNTGEPVLAKLEKVEWRDGRETWSESSKFPLRDEHGEIMGTFGLTYDVTERQHTAHELEKTRRDLLDASRVAGMAEVATGVLHNVGNVLTSLNVSASVVATGLRQGKVESLVRVVDLLEQHRADLSQFVTQDAKGRLIPEFIDSLSRHMIGERDRLLAELAGLQQNIDHIKEIITMQQAYATTAGVVETLEPSALVEDALRMNSAALMRHEVSVVREYHPVPPIRGERAKVLQILVNLIRNAKYAADDGGGADKIITVRVLPGDPGRVRLVIADNGIGIPPENMGHLFQHGFTTRGRKGHGFGLHSARRAALDLHGTLTATSEGLGHGAQFALELPAADAGTVAFPSAPAYS